MKHLKLINRFFKIARFCATLLCFVPSAQSAEYTTHFHLDPAGTPLMATDDAGNIVWKETYQPYGSKLNYQPAASSNTLGYTGKPYDNATGLSYMGARYYNPALGRFMGVDPVGYQEGNPHSHNRYAYANNNPYKFVDPDGRQAVGLSGLSSMEADFAGYKSAMVNAYSSAVSMVVLDRVVAALGKLGAMAYQGLQATRSAEQTIGIVAKEAAPVAVNAAQQQNIGRFVGKHANDVKDSLTVHGLPNGSIAAQITVPGKVPGSKAIYEKQIAVEGTTYQSTKTTYDPKGDIIHSKDKAYQITDAINFVIKE